MSSGSRIAFGGIAGGLGSVLAGGNLWEGAAIGAVVVALNHLGSHEGCPDCPVNSRGEAVEPNATLLGEVRVTAKRSEVARIFGHVASGFLSAGYFTSNRNDRNNYSPYNPAAITLQVGFEVSGVFGTVGFEGGIGFGNQGLALFGTTKLGIGIQAPGFGLTADMGFMDYYGGQTDMFDALRGEDLGWEGSAILSGGYSTSADTRTGFSGLPKKGANTLTFGLHPSIGNYGVKRIYSNTTVLPLWRRR